MSSSITSNCIFECIYVVMRQEHKNNWTLIPYALGIFLYSFFRYRPFITNPYGYISIYGGKIKPSMYIKFACSFALSLNCCDTFKCYFDDALKLNCTIT